MTDEQRIPIVTPTGEVGDVAAGDLRAALDAGARLSTREEYGQAQLQTAKEEAQAKHEEEIGTLGRAAETVASFGMGLQRTASFGLSDVLYKQYAKLGEAAGLLKEGSYEKLAQAGEYNPTAGTLGEVAGAFVPGGAVGLAGKVGEALPVASKIVKGAVTAGAENAAFGMGEKIGHATITNEDLSAEKLFSVAAKDFLIGAAVGGGLGVIAKGATKTAELAKGAAESVTEKVLGDQTVKQFIKEQADESLFRAFGASKKTFEKADRLGGTSGVADIIRDELPKYVDKNIRHLTPGDYSVAARKAMTDLEPQYEKAISHLDSIAKKAGDGISVKNIIEKFDESIKRYSMEYGGKRELNALIENKNQFLHNVGIDPKKISFMQEAANSNSALEQILSFKDVKKLEAGLGKQAYKEAKAGVFLDGLADMRRSVDSMISQKGEELANLAGEKFAENYKLLDRKYGAWKLVKDAAEKGKSAGKQNLGLGLIEQQAALGGAALGGALGGPVGGVMGAGLAAGARHFVKARGDAYAADFLYKLIGYGNVDRTVQAVTQKSLNAAKEAVYTTAKRATPEAFAKTEIAQVATKLREVAANPQRLAELQAKVTGPLTRAGMNSLQGKVAAVGARAVEYLAMTSPKPKGAQPNLFAALKGKQEVRYSDSDLHEFNNRIKTVEDPDFAFGKLADGTIDRATIETLKAVYPEKYAEMQTHIMGWITELNKEGRLDEIKYMKRLQIGVLLGIPTDPTMEPDFIKLMQQTMMENEPGLGGQKQVSGRTKPLEPSDRSANTMVGSIAINASKGVK